MKVFVYKIDILILNLLHEYFISNLPLGLAPGIGLSAYLVYGLVLGEQYTIKEAFTTVIINIYIYIYIYINIFRG